MSLQIPHGLYWTEVEVECCHLLRLYLLVDGFERSLQGDGRNLIEGVS